MWYFNIDILNCNNSTLTTKYINLMTEYHFIFCINSLTRVSQHSKSCIDHIFVKSFSVQNIKSFVFNSDLTDHFITIFTFTNSQCLNTEVKIIHLF